MKKFFFLAAIAATIVFSISSCSKKEDAEIIDALLGDYSGTLEVGGSSSPNTDVHISRVSEDRVNITPTGGTAFYADVTVTATGWQLTVPPQTNGTSDIEGNSALVPSVPDAHGAYTSNGQLSYSVIVTTSGVDVTENYQGNK